MANLEFMGFSDHIEYYTTIGNGTLCKGRVHYYGNCTVLKEIEKNYIPYPTVFLGGHSQPNPTHVEHTNILVKNFLHYYWPISYPIQFLGHPTQRNILLELLPSISQQMCETKNFLTYTTTTTVLRGDVAPHA